MYDPLDNQDPGDAVIDDPPNSTGQLFSVGNLDPKTGKPDGRMFSRTPPDWIQDRMRQNAAEAVEGLTDEEKAKRQETHDFYRSFATTIPSSDRRQDRRDERASGDGAPSGTVPVDLGEPSARDGHSEGTSEWRDPPVDRERGRVWP